MPLAIHALDEEFAAVTNTKVNVTAVRSLFHTPPDTYRNLVISLGQAPQPGPKLRLGDSCSLSWAGQEGPVTVETAEVTRADQAADGSGIVVFQGNDASGDPALVIWTPGNNLVEWHKSHAARRNGEAG